MIKTISESQWKHRCHVTYVPLNATHNACRPARPSMQLPQRMRVNELVVGGRAALAEGRGGRCVSDKKDGRSENIVSSNLSTKDHSGAVSGGGGGDLVELQ